VVSHQRPVRSGLNGCQRWKGEGGGGKGGREEGEGGLPWSKRDGRDDSWAQRQPHGCLMSEWPAADYRIEENGEAAAATAAKRRRGGMEERRTLLGEYVGHGVW